MSRVDGRKIVGIAVVGIASTIAVAQIYAPFFMDRDGMTGSKTMSKEEQRREMAVAMAIAGSAGQTNEVVAAEPPTRGSRSAGSMWHNMKRRD